MNVVMHGGDGEALLKVSPESIVLVFSDQGPGIPDIELAFKPGYSTASLEHREMGFGAGMGLPNIKKSADTVEVQTEKGRGTILTIGFELGSGSGG
jgi:anti-sigma regulatory factor (Ser/Thr protein kinase)